ncbi:MAG: RNA polymerase sigma factor [Candidatus Aminicenantes bacterium]|nr:RNA polymerase sigma factor [Candidatus Aminicenantes bacterium]
MGMSLVEEKATIAACLAGQGEEFRLLVDAYKSQTMAMAMNVLGNRQDAEDVCQEAYIQAYRHLARFDPARSFRTWILTILYRRCLDVLKRKRRFRTAFQRLSHEPALKNKTMDEVPAERGDLARIVQGRLSPKERAAVSLWANEGLNSAEISGIIGCSPSTARVCLFNARRKIKTILEKRDAGAR